MKTHILHAWLILPKCYTNVDLFLPNSWHLIKTDRCILHRRWLLIKESYRFVIFISVWKSAIVSPHHGWYFKLTLAPSSIPDWISRSHLSFAALVIIGPTSVSFWSPMYQKKEEKLIKSKERGREKEGSCPSWYV